MKKSLFWILLIQLLVCTFAGLVPQPIKSSGYYEVLAHFLTDPTVSNGYLNNPPSVTAEFYLESYETLVTRDLIFSYWDPWGKWIMKYAKAGQYMKGWVSFTNFSDAFYYVDEWIHHPLEFYKSEEDIPQNNIMAYGQLDHSSNYSWDEEIGEYNFSIRDSDHSNLYAPVQMTIRHDSQWFNESIEKPTNYGFFGTVFEKDYQNLHVEIWMHVSPPGASGYPVTTCFLASLKSQTQPPNPSYPSDVWERIWYVNNGGGEFGSYVGLGPNETNVEFSNDWGDGTVSYGRADLIGFVSSRAIHLDAGTWKFTVDSDDGFRLYFDDVLVLDKWSTGPKTYSVERSFSSDYDHRFRLDWFEDWGSARISFDMAQVSSPTGEITNVAITKKAYKAGEVASFNVEVENRGNIDSDFWVRYTLYHPGEASWPKNTFFRSQAFNAYVGIGQVHTFNLAWAVPEDAAAGVYNLNVILYAGPKNPDQDPNVPAIDTDTIHFALIVDQDVSFIQVMEIPTFIGQKRVVYNHIAKEDVAKSGTLTFLYLTSMLQVARMVADMGRATSDLHILGKGLTDAFTWAGINKRVAKMRDDGSFDILHVQILGQGAWCYEDTTPLDIDLSLGLPIKTPLNYLNILPEQYLAFETPYFSEIQFDWSYAAYMPAMTDFFPYWKFSGGETWYPCSFYFDNDADVTNNKDNYTKAELETGRPPYFVYIHVVEDAKYLTIQYWLYYVYNEYHGIISGMKPHMHDWDSAVFVIFEKPNLQTPKKVGFCYHIFGYTLDWNDFSLQKEGNHVIVYVAEGSHGSHHNPAVCPPWDEWHPGGITLGHENLTNWIIVENCVHETTLPNEGSKVFCELYHIAHGCVEPAPPSVKKDSIVYWPKDFPGVSEAIWHQEDKWRNTEPPWFTLFVAAHSPVNICLEDSSGRRTGVDSSGNVLNEIPDSLYSGPNAEPETVAVLNPTENYTVHVYGTSSGTFGLESWIYLCGTESVICNSTGITIQEDQTINYVIPELPSAFAPMLFMLVLTITAILNRKRLVKIRAER